MSLPDGYVELEYLESTGVEYIDTRFVPNANTRVEVTYENPSATQGVCVVGSDTTWQSNGFALYSHVFEFGWSYYAYTLTANKQTITLDHGWCIVDNSYKSSMSGTVNSGYSLYMFANHRGGGVREFLTGRIFSCNIWNQGAKVRTFIPCKSDTGVIGMWDDFEGKLYTNSGTGAFIAGPEVVSGKSEVYVKVNGVWKTAGSISVSGY